MVEFSYQMMLSTLQTVALLVGIIYYILTLRNTQKTRELTLQSQELSRKALEHASETRQVQLFMDFYKLDTSQEFGNILMEMIWLWEWDDYDDSIKKYGPVSGSVDDYSKMISVFLHFDGLGVQAKKGLLDFDDVCPLYNTRVIPLWEKYATLIYEARRRANSPQVYEHFEWLYDELKRIEVNRGHGFSKESVFKLEENEETPNT